MMVGGLPPYSKGFAIIAVATKLCAAASQSARPEPGNLEWIHVLS